MTTKHDLDQSTHTPLLALNPQPIQQLNPLALPRCEVPIDVIEINLRQNFDWLKIYASMNLKNFDGSPLWLARFCGLPIEHVFDALDSFVKVGVAALGPDGYQCQKGNWRRDHSLPPKDPLESAKDDFGILATSMVFDLQRTANIRYHMWNQVTNEETIKLINSKVIELITELIESAPKDSEKLYHVTYLAYEAGGHNPNLSFHASPKLDTAE